MKWEIEFTRKEVLAIVEAIKAHPGDTIKGVQKYKLHYKIADGEPY